MKLVRLLGALLALQLLAPLPGRAETLTFDTPSSGLTQNVGYVFACGGTWGGGALNQYYKIVLKYYWQPGDLPMGDAGTDLRPQVTGSSNNHGNWSVDWDTAGRDTGTYTLRANLYRSSNNTDWGSSLVEKSKTGFHLN
jgi:hypothetical protein